MTFAPLPVTKSNETAVDTYVDRIKQHLSDATFAWRQISEILAAAADEFGLDSDRMKSLRKKTKFSKSKVSKLIAIATNKRLRDHYATFQSTEAWTVLYEITKLTDDEFTKLIDSLDDDQIVTQADVNSAKTKIVAEVDPYKTVFNIQIDVNAIKCGIFTGDDYEELREAIETIQNTLNHVRVTETNQFENDAARFCAEIEREFDRLTREEFNEAKKRYKKQAKDKSMMGIYSEDELNFLMHNKEYETAFGALGSDQFDQTRLYNEAIKKVYEKRQKKFGPLVRPHNEFANTALQTAA